MGMLRSLSLHMAPLYAVAWVMVAIYLCDFQSACAQPTVQQFYWEETCDKNKDDEIRKALDFILLEVQRQKHENRELRTELEEMKQKSTEHRFLLIQLSDNVSLLVQKLLNSSNYCNCRGGDGGSSVGGSGGSVRPKSDAELPQADSKTNLVIKKDKQKHGLRTTTPEASVPGLSLEPTFTTTTTSTTPRVDPLLQIYNGFVPRGERENTSL